MSKLWKGPIQRRVTLWTVGLAVIVFVVCVGFKYYAMSHRGWSGRGESGGKRVDEWQGNAAPESSLLNLARSEPQPFEGISTGLPHFMKSPYVYGGPSINVKGLAGGTEVECPTTGKILTVPSGMGWPLMRWGASLLSLS